MSNRQMRFEVAQRLPIYYEQLVEGLAVNNVGFNVKNVSVKEVRRANVAGGSKNDPPKGADSFNAQVIVLNYPGQVGVGYSVLIPLGRRTKLLRQGY